MLKRFANNKNKAILVLLQQGFAIAMVVILLIIITGSCIKTADGDREFVNVNFFETEKDFQKSETFRYLFLDDINGLGRYLTICKQFENHGEFDKNKTIDLLQYVNRRELNASEISSNGALEYRIGDLINWHEVDGLETRVSNQTALNDEYSDRYYEIIERYLPADQESLEKKDLFQILFQAGIVDENCNELTSEIRYPYNDSNVEVTIEEAYDDEYDEYEENYDTDYASEETTEVEVYDADGNVTTTVSESSEADTAENYGAIGGDFNEDGTLKDPEAEAERRRIEHCNEKAKAIVAEYVINAAGDLASNYGHYCEVEDYYKENNSFKYLYIQNGEKENFYTNCTGKESAKELVKAFKTAMKTGTGSYIKYDFDKDDIETVNYDADDKNHTNIRNTLHEYDYSFQGNGTLYVAYINSNEESNLLDGCDLLKNTKYSQSAKVYSQIKPHITDYAIGMLCCMVAFFVCFLVWTCLVGYRKEEEGEGEEKKTVYRAVRAEELTGFDKWYTGIAFGIACFIEIIVFLGMMFLILDGYLDGNLGVLSSDELIGCSILLTVLLVAGFQFFWASLVRRLRAHTIFKNSVIYHLYLFIKKSKDFLFRITFGLIIKVFKKIGAFFKKILYMISDTNMWVRLWVPYFLFLLANLILISIGYAMTDFILLGIIFAFLFDMGVGFFLMKDAKEKDTILEGINRIADGEITYQLKPDEMHGENALFAEAVNRIGDGIHEAVEISMKDERLKADLITNVSHDIKTPLTSIINYVDLLKRIDIQDEKAKEYLQILDEKSQRLKQLTLDLVEASKISSGNIVLHFEDIKVKDLMLQVAGEFADKFEEKQLTLVANFPEDAVFIKADSRRMWRVMENLFNNIYKYAMPGTRVYLDVEKKDKVWITVKNISAQELNIKADELTERFIRGDVSRSTEGSGLGLSIAKSLVEAQNGSFRIVLDGDLFKVHICFEVEV